MHKTIHTIYNQRFCLELLEVENQEKQANPGSPGKL